MFTSKDYTPKKRTVPFIRINGRLVRDTRGREVEVRSNVKGDSLVKFNNSYPIGFHKWS